MLCGLGNVSVCQGGIGWVGCDFRGWDKVRSEILLRASYLSKGGLTCLSDLPQLIEILLQKGQTTHGREQIARGAKES